MNIVITIIIFLFITPILLAFFVNLIYINRAKKIHQNLSRINTPFMKKFDDFIIINPYQNSGNYYKAQLHTHSKNSDGKLNTDELIKIYKDKAYSFLAITDHNKIIENHNFDDQQFITIPGEEMTLADPFRPLGQHILRLFVRKKTKSKDLQTIINTTKKDKGIIVINHPSSFSGLGTQCWKLEQLLKLKYIHFIEIKNHFSDEEKNIIYWHELLKNNGPENPVWGIASDDSHKTEDIDKEWIMVKMNNFNEDSFHDALLEGSFYLSQGPDLSFKVENKNISVKSDQNLKFKFIDANHKVLKEIYGDKASYSVQGNEGFIRIEGKNKKTNRKAWSQPFWLKETD